MAQRRRKQVLEGATIKGKICFSFSISFLLKLATMRIDTNIKGNVSRDHGGKLCFDFGVDILNKMT